MCRFADADDQLNLLLKHCSAEFLDPIGCLIASVSRLWMPFEVRRPLLEVPDFCTDVEKMFG